MNDPSNEEMFEALLDHCSGNSAYCKNKCKIYNDPEFCPFRKMLHDIEGMYTKVIA